MEAETLAMAQEIDFSMWALFARATLIVKLVMLMLIIGVVLGVVDHHPEADHLSRGTRARRISFDARFWSGEPLDELFEEIGPDPAGRSERIFAAGMMEWRRSHRDRRRADRRAPRRGSTAAWTWPSPRRPSTCKVGFRCWPRGVHRAFRGAFRHRLGHHERLHRIAEQQNTNLAVVAPGIAEAFWPPGWAFWRRSRR